MPKTVTVEIDARAFDKDALANSVDRQLVTVEMTLTPEADSHGEAIVRALRHAADVAAARLGLLDLLRLDEPR